MHCKSKMVPEAVRSLEGTSASSVRTQLCQIHQCDRYCNGLGLRASAWRARPWASRARPCSNKTKRFWNSSGRGRQRSEPFSLPVFKNEISNKHGGKKSSGQLEGGNKSSWSGNQEARPVSLCCRTCWKSERSCSACLPALPLPCKHPADPEDQLQHPLPGAHSQVGAELAWTLELSSPIPSPYRWEN